jgi:hypothetical protein
VVSDTTSTVLEKELTVIHSYANMDFVVMASLAGLTLLLLTISYNITCQWKIHLKERLEKLPKDMQLPPDIKLQCALLVWHAGSHNNDCQNENSLSFKPGVGKSNGEGIERTWFRLNSAAAFTKDTGNGQPADTLEGMVDDHNFLKNVGQGEFETACGWLQHTKTIQGDALQQRLVVAIAEHDRQIEVFKDVNKTVSKEVRDEWKAMIDDWLATPSKTNPYTLKLKVVISAC